jgi:hypothetical protein
MMLGFVLIGSFSINGSLIFDVRRLLFRRLLCLRRLARHRRRHG